MIIATASKRATCVLLVLLLGAFAEPARRDAAAASPNAVTNSTLDNGITVCSAELARRNTSWADSDACRRSGQQPSPRSLYSRDYFDAMPE